MKLKKILAALAAAVMLCGMTGCSSGGTSSADTAERTLVSKTKNGRPESPGVLRGSSDLNKSNTVSNS